MSENVQPPESVSQPPTENAKRNGYAVTGLILGIAGVFLFNPFSIVPILAIVFGGIGLNKAHARPGKPGMVSAWIGLILGIVYTIVAWVHSHGLA